MTKITFLAHATTSDNEKNLATGAADTQLSEVGIQQGKQLGIDTKNQQFDVVFCSDLKRAVDTANLAFKNKYKIIIDPRLRECDYGDWNKTPDDFKVNAKDNINSPFPNGESYKDVEKRMNEFLNFLKQNYAGKNVAIVSHQAPQLALDVLLKGKTWEQAIDEDWRKTKAYQPGWEYTVN